MADALFLCGLALGTVLVVILIADAIRLHRQRKATAEAAITYILASLRAERRKERELTHSHDDPSYEHSHPGGKEDHVHG